MGKHKSSAQDGVFLKFMEKNKDIARGFVTGDKLKMQALWKELTTELNCNGPPQKDTSSWKKVWLDWKTAIRRKVAHNNSEARATGGGPFNKHVLSPTEEAVAEICGIFTVVEGITDTLDFGAPNIEDSRIDSVEDALPMCNLAAASTFCTAASTAFTSSGAEASCSTGSTGASSAARTSSASVAASPPDAGASTTAGSQKRRRDSSADEPITKYIKEQTCSMAAIARQMEERLVEGKENLRHIREIRNQMREVNSFIRKMASALTESNEENKRHHFQMEKLRQEELFLKRQKLDLEERRLNFEESQRTKT